MLASALGAIYVVVSPSTFADEPTTQWRESTSRHGNRTRIENLDGSVWPRTPTLVEELSVGDEIGPEPYLLGRVIDLATSAERIYVLDANVGLVRGYSLDGRHALDIGGRGPGPGEFERPWAVAVDGAGRVYVQSRSEIEVFAADGTPLSTWTLENPRISNRGPVSFAVDDDGTAYVTESIGRDRERPWIGEYALIPFTNGEAGPSRVLREIVPRGAFAELWTNPRSYLFWPVPFVPRTVTAVSRRGTVVSGYPDEYSFEYQATDGSVLEVVKYWDPIPVQPNELESYLAGFKASRPVGEAWVIPEERPRTKPAFEHIVVDDRERAWVFRHGVGQAFECGPQSGQNSCWRYSFLLDVFDSQGRFLGEAILPDELVHRQDLLSVPVDVHGDSMTIAIEDEDGIVRVKRYRLEAPEQGH